MNSSRTFPICKLLRPALLLCISAVLLSATPSIAEDPRFPGWVVIPVTEYRNLYSKAYPAEPEPEMAPVQATLTRIDYDLHISGDLAKGRVELTVDVQQSAKFSQDQLAAFSRPTWYMTSLQVGSVSETVEVTAQQRELI
jgi:hypothetical protein